MRNIVEFNTDWIQENDIIVHDYGNGVWLLENFVPKDIVEHLTKYLDSFPEYSWRNEYLQVCMTKYNQTSQNQQHILSSHEDIIHAIATKTITDLDGFFWNYERDYSRTLSIKGYKDQAWLDDRWASLFKVTNSTDKNNITIDQIEDIARLTEGQELEAHTDGTKEGSLLYATVFYINDNYEGGELYFPDIDVVIKPEMGSLCVFDGSKLLKHGVKTVTKGTRYNSTIFVWDESKDNTWRLLHR